MDQVPVFGQPETGRKNPKAGTKKTTETNSGSSRRNRSEMIDLPPPTQCCLCDDDLPPGHKYLCESCGDDGFIEADDALWKDRADRRAAGVPVHGGATWSER